MKARDTSVLGGGRGKERGLIRGEGLAWLIFCARATRGLGRVGEEWPGALHARSVPTIKEWNDTRADPLLPERARSECARSTAAVGPTRVPFPERKNKRAWKDHL